jgi:hypothetical protein
MRASIYLLFLLSVSVLGSCKLKSGLSYPGIVNESINASGIYALRLCYETRIIDGLEVSFYEPCSDVDSISGWNHLTYFEFIDDGLVEYHSLPAKRKNKSNARKRVTVPEFSGRYTIVDDTIPGQKLMQMTLAEKRKKIKSKKALKQIKLELVMLEPGKIQMRRIEYFDYTQKRVYDLQEIFPEKASFIYCFECVEDWTTDFCGWPGE